MLETILWWLTIELVGLAAVPLALRVFRFLPDRGYPFARPLGLLLTAYALWLSATFGLLANQWGTIVVLVAGLGGICWWRWGDDARHFWKERRSLVLLVEVLFAVSLGVWALVRAYDPAIAGTEKPMEFAFINAILRSDAFPPADPWLAGYSISYYYFGYVMMALLVKLSGIPSALTFGLIGALLFALSTTGVFSLGYNLAEALRRARGRADLTPFSLEGLGSRGPEARRERRAEDEGAGALEAAGSEGAGEPVLTLSRSDREAGQVVRPTRRSGSEVALAGRSGPSEAAFHRASLHRGPVLCGLLTVVFLVILGNLEGFFEILNARQAIGPGFWAFLQIKDMPQPYLSPSGFPTDNWWWWRASRVIGDFDLASGASRDYTINEFPFFSFMLGDVHPHVLALPFVLMSLGLSLNALRAPAWTWWKHLPRTALLALCFGALGFLNTWDMPTFLAIFLAAFAAGRFAETHRLDPRWLGHWLSLGAAMGGAAVLLYLPFYITFSSQAAGLGAVLVHSQLRHFLIFWAPFLLLVTTYLAWQVVAWARSGLRLPVGTLPGERGTLRPEFDLSPPIVAVLGGLSIAAGAGLFRLGIPVLGLLLPLIVAGLLLLLRWSGLQAFPDGTGPGSLGRRCSAPAEARPLPDAGRERFFIMLLLVFALLLLAFCEVIFLRDLFGNRMNTVFKFYYQAWVLLAVVCAAVVYSLAVVWRRAAPAWRLAGSAWGAVVGLVVMAALFYPLAAIWSKANGFALSPSLNGLEGFARSREDDYRAIVWLNSNVDGAPSIVEANGGSYSQAGRISMATGLPTLLGWDFHERQWRGPTIDAEANARKRAVEAIYRATPEAIGLLKQYGVRYIIVGQLERDAFFREGPAAQDRLGALGDVVYRQGSVTIYRVRD